MQINIFKDADFELNILFYVFGKSFDLSIPIFIYFI